MSDCEYKEFLREKMIGKKIGIWGTGQYSIYAESFLRNLSISEWNYVDISIEKQGKIYKGKRVYSPDYVADSNEWFILLSMLHSNTLVDKLKNQGLNELDDFICVLKNDLYYYLFVDYGKDCSAKLKNINVQNFGEKGCGFSVYCDGYTEKSQIILYSFGIGEDLSFSQEFSDKYPQCEIYAFDPTPKAAEFVKKYDRNKLKLFRFFEYGLSDTGGNHTFYLPNNPQYVSASEFCTTTVNENESIQVEMHTLRQFMDMLGHTHIDLVKMDIEGSEFVAIPQFLREGIFVSQICVELHNRMMPNGEFERQKLLKLLNQYGYRLIYISESGEELTFVRNY